jgi:hypothetical protein
MSERAPELVLPVVSVAITTSGVFYVLSPLLTGLALIEVHDASRLLHFPISYRTLALSSFLSNVFQPTVLSAIPVAVAGALGIARVGWALPLALAGALLGLAFLLAAAQAVGLLLQGLARQRRWHDVAVTLAIGLGFATSLIPLLVLGRAPMLGRVARLLAEYDVFRFSPFAWGARAAVHASRGDLPLFGLYAGAQLVAILGAMALSSVLLARMSRGELVATEKSDRSRPARMVLPGAVGALIEKDLRTGLRDPARRAALVMSLLSPLVFLLILGRSSGPRSAAPVLMVSLLVGLSPFGSNAFAFERRGVSLLMGFPVARAWILVGKNLATLAFRLPGLAVLLAMGFLVAPTHVLPSAFTVAFVTMILAVGVDNFVSILAPTPAPPPGGDPYAGMSGSRGLGAAAIGAMGLALVMVLSAPFAFLAWLPLLLRTPVAFAALPLAVVGALGAYTMLVISAERLLSSREPELLERVLEAP